MALAAAKAIFTGTNFDEGIDALKDMQSDVVDLAFGISEKLLARSIRDADTEKLADRLFDSRIEGENGK